MSNIDSYYDLKDFFDVEDISHYIFKVNYTNADYETNEFLITYIHQSEYGPGYFDAFCIDEDGYIEAEIDIERDIEEHEGDIEEYFEECFKDYFETGARTFKISRLNDIELVRRKAMKTRDYN